MRRRRIKRLARREGLSVTPRGQSAAIAAAARREQLKALNAEAITDGRALTAGHYVADSGQRELYLPFESAVTVDNAAAATGTLRVTVQRPMMIRRVVLSAADTTAFTDALNTIGVTGIFIGVQPIFNANGVAPAVAFANNAVGVKLATPVARVGSEVTVNLQRLFAVTNDANVSGYVVGVSAEQ